jgi:hypothetical protein
MRGIWMIEFAEVDAISRAEVSRIKAFGVQTSTPIDSSFF